MVPGRAFAVLSVPALKPEFVADTTTEIDALAGVMLQSLCFHCFLLQRTEQCSLAVVPAARVETTADDATAH